ncbi:MAG: hypothetical protein COV74_03045 [Candidatus Omnitrophica bacterium CG11_big_fil_rev_8_21_14_0_20_45_26]|uniref:NAD-dependent epimerase/dehydratase domain-containing protein n=1 Tax=Candidatus Abzuiibacterium crystallinum TaxID=1974748 RepID=A0A2H0LTR1_9BACT|nr:MAG: hypothetical protein COV74_03045 [Candidatus Omnitrophica bacterium CG11_big_fil_rev_8_21_14_0_20_45_26]PIW64714.1 MAG: hypothetical protein COW12_05070 [Candidatus Omnitrophica bacterium CG12_big_fil_rev_8_21_14_0_65_45_16]
MNQHVVVTGGAGYIGSILVPELLRNNFQVTVIDNLMYKQKSLAAIQASDRYQFIEGDVREIDQLVPYFEKADVIIPLAALVGAPLCDQRPEEAVQINQEAIRKMCGVLSERQKILIPTTNSGYGIGEKGKMCTEESPMNPLSLYARTKVEAEKIVLRRQNSISFRLATVFGVSPRMRIDLLVNDFTYRAWKDGSLEIFEGHFKRNYIHVKDVARAFLHGINHFSKLCGQVYNVGLSEANLSKLELCQAIQNHLPSFKFTESATGKDPDQRDYIVSNEKIEKTGFKPTHRLDDGIRELIEAYTKQEVCISRNA